ncbi:putative short chain dehydrogenase [Paratrimastix pyriformis]|uniref:Short chain dehydrogenase n=1 Tax=Paratrimastix pyriformis TaxID=342808 RepID=A0ABQ8UXV2_9EUKA|nr:putative short chain dehydrogenase [Paratrimastix pyriformis]
MAPACAACWLGAAIILFTLWKIAKRCGSPKWNPTSSVVITGASSGIGSELAKLYSKRGARLLLTGRNSERLEAVAAECAKVANALTEIHTCRGDLTEPIDRKELAEQARKYFGAVDMLILNAGISMDNLFSDTAGDMALFRSLMETNFFACVGCAKEFEQLLKAHRGSKIVVVSSMSGLLPVYRRTGYSASKHAVHGFFDSLRLEWSPWDIKVTIACPGFVDTPIRETAVREGRAVELRSPEKHLVSAASCARDIALAVDQNQVHAIFSLRDRLAGWCFLLPGLGSVVRWGIARKFRAQIESDLKGRL